MKLTNNQKKIRIRLLEIMHRYNFPRIGSCLNVIDIIDAVYSVKKPGEKFILSNGHTAGALYIILEKNNYLNNPNLEKLGVHPDRNPAIGIDVSTGSLGQGLPIAIGCALSNRKKNVYCLISDGECAEGSIWESLRIIHDLNIMNLKIIVSANGWGAYDPVSPQYLFNRLKGFGFKMIKVNGHNTSELIKKLSQKNKQLTIYFAKTSSEQFPFLKGQHAHYYAMKDCDYELAIKQCHG